MMTMRNYRSHETPALATAIATARKAFTLSLLLMSVARAAWAQNPKPDLSENSLDTLANAEITSVSRKEEKLSQAAAAVFVITQEDIRRSGLTSIPEILRMVIRIWIDG
jgi:iron complex outermembrane recepter protein